ncbi:hypothetical protein D3C84_642750 [compost metagenome]
MGYKIGDHLKVSLEGSFVLHQRLLEDDVTVRLTSFVDPLKGTRIVKSVLERFYCGKDHTLAVVNPFVSREHDRCTVNQELVITFQCTGE